METTSLPGEPAVREATAVSHAAPLRCSIILPMSVEPFTIMAYLDRLQRQSLSNDCEIIVGDQGDRFEPLQQSMSMPQVRVIAIPGASEGVEAFDVCAGASRGDYLLFVRDLVDLDLAMLGRSIRELEDSANELSVSDTGTFVLVRRSLYGRVGRLRELLEQLGVDDRDAGSLVRISSHRVRNLNNDPLLFSCGPNTVVDADVIIDTPERVKIGAHCVIRKGVVLRPEGGEIIIGDHCVVNHYCIFHGKGGIYIGDWTIIAPHCGFYAQNHTFERFDLPITKQPNIGRGIYLMGDNWIGGGAVVCDDVTIGKGAVIGANSTVTRSIPMACVAVGSPARVVRKRHGENWDFHQRERAALKGMPDEIGKYVHERGRRIAECIREDDHVLDIGCGEGIITSLLARKCRHVVGCDYSAEAVEAAAQGHPGLEFVCSNSTCLRFEKGSFTKVVLSEVAEHLMPVQFVRALDEMGRVLRPGGMLILTTPLTGKGTDASTYAHIYEYSEQEIAALLGRVFERVQLWDKEFGIFIARKKESP